MNDLTSAMGKFEGGTRDTDDIISDDELFKPPPPKEDCPICLLRYCQHLNLGQRITPVVEK